MGSAYTLQPAGTTMDTGLINKKQIPTSVFSHVGASHLVLTGHPHRTTAVGLNVTMTIIDQNTTLPTMSVTAHSDHLVMLMSPSTQHCLMASRKPQGWLMTNQGYTEATSHQEGTLFYYYDHNSLGHLTSRGRGKCLHNYGSGSYHGSLVSVSPPEIVMVQKEIETQDIQPSFSTAAICYPTFPEVSQTTLSKVSLQEEEKVVRSKLKGDLALSLNDGYSI